MTAKLLVASLVATAIVLSAPTVAFAEELIITGNGNDSSSQVSVTSDSNTSVQQSNTAQINNQVSNTSNTGSNTTSSNSGPTQIDTGNTSNNTTIDNSNINPSFVDTTGCCQNPSAPTNTSLTITENGTDTTNTAATSQTNLTHVTTIQNAVITNNIHGTSNTGNNTASNNSGDQPGQVSIQTGNITVNNQILNSDINYSQITLATNSNPNLDLKIAGNGAGSTNNVYFTSKTPVNIFQNFSANINNFLFWNANTGGNIASNNAGSVLIFTGNIWIDNYLKNDQINVGGVNINSCNCLNPSPTPSPTSPPTSTPPAGGGTDQTSDRSPGGSSNGSSQSSNRPSGTGEVLGAAIGGLLPATGNNDLLNISLFLLEILLLGIFLQTNSKQISHKFRLIKSSNYSTFLLKFS